MEVTQFLSPYFANVSKLDAVFHSYARLSMDGRYCRIMGLAMKCFKVRVMRVKLRKQTTKQSNLHPSGLDEGSAGNQTGRNPHALIGACNTLALEFWN